MTAAAMRARERPADDVNRCAWALKEIFHRYHDEEWGVPVHDDRRHFEFLVLEAAQAGLSWSTVLNKRDGSWTESSGTRSARCCGKKSGEVCQPDGSNRWRCGLSSSGNGRYSLLSRLSTGRFWQI